MKPDSEPPKPTQPITHIDASLPEAKWVDKVFLDDIEQSDAVAASETEGWVTRWERTPDGDLRVTDEDGLVSERVEGEVRITLRDTPRPDRYKAEIHRGTIREDAAQLIESALFGEWEEALE